MPQRLIRPKQTVLGSGTSVSTEILNPFLSIKAPVPTPTVAAYKWLSIARSSFVVKAGMVTERVPVQGVANEGPVASAECRNELSGAKL